MGSTYCLVIEGHLPDAVGDILSHRFTDVRVYSAAVRTVVECSVVDQPALRSLLTQVWDVGGTVLLVADVTSSQKGRNSL